MAKKEIQKHGGALIRPEKGESMNLKGRPKGSKNRSTIARKWLEATQKIKNPITGETETLTQEDIMTLALIKKAREGDVQAYTKLLDSGYGLPQQSMSLTGDQQQPVAITAVKILREDGISDPIE